MTALAINSSPQSILHRTGAFIVLAAALTSLGYSVWAGELSFLAIYIVCVVCGSAIALRTAGAEFGQANALSLFLIVFSVNVLMIVAFAHVLTGLTGGPFLDAPQGVIPDDERFYDYGTSIAHAWLRGETPEFPLGVKFYGYPYILAACNAFSAYFGDMSPVSPRLLNAAVGALLPLTIYRIALLTYEDRQVARTAALLTALFPVFTFYSSLLLRDMIVAYLVAVAILVFLKSVNTDGSASRAAQVGMLGLVLAGLFFVRDLSAFVPLAGFAIYIFARQPGWAKFVLLVVAAVLVVQVMAVLDMDAPKIRMYLTYTERAMEVFARIESQDSLGMRYIIGAPFPFNIALRIPYTALMPIPPIVGTDLLNIVRGSGATIWYFLFPLWVYGMWKSRENARSNLITIISLLFLLGIAMVSIDLRHKTQFLGLAMIHVSFAANSLNIRTRQVVITTSLILGILAVFYLFLRFAR